MSITTPEEHILWALKSGRSLAPFQIAQALRRRSPGFRTAKVTQVLWKMLETHPVDCRSSGMSTRWWRTDIDPLL